MIPAVGRQNQDLLGMIPADYQIALRCFETLALVTTAKPQTKYSYIGDTSLPTPKALAE
jgi:hypothetical protein